mmetsp:Transcript_28526/g.37321  ORF Transcript_28526/g.37321 Transcript_28526/m.37321 type:complete len:711 (+) Transcript_28526:60-2192(+)
MLRQFLRLGIDQEDADAKHIGRIDLTGLDNDKKHHESHGDKDEDSQRLISSIGEPVQLSQPMQLRLPREDPSMDASASTRSYHEGPHSTPDAPRLMPRRAWQKADAKDHRGTPSKKMGKDSSAGFEELKGMGGSSRIYPNYQNSGYWVVRNLGRSKEKRGVACIGEMDTTSVFAFRAPSVRGGGTPGGTSRQTSISSGQFGSNYPSPPNTSRHSMRMGDSAGEKVVRYNEPVLLFTNYGVGGRFLAPAMSSGMTNTVAGSHHRARVVWQTTEEDIHAGIARRQQLRAGRTRVYAFEKENSQSNSNSQESPNRNDFDSDSDDELSMFRDLKASPDRLVKWVVRKAGQWPPKPWEDKQAYLGLREVIRCGDIIMLESYSMPGWYMKAKNCLTKLEKGPAGAEIQIMAPSLSFAVSLRERTAQYAASAGNTQNMRKIGFNLRHMGITPRRERGPHPINSIFMEKKLPSELLRYCVSFFAGLEGSYDSVSFNNTDIVTKQKIQNSVPFSVRRDGMNAIRAVRLVCHPWKDVANSLILSIKTGDMTEVSSKHQREQLVNFILSCDNVTKLSLRNMDCIRTADLEPLSQLRFLRNLNLGGCYRISDHIVEIIKPLSIVDLNLAMTQITDEGLELIVNHQPYLCDLNLYGCEGVTEVGIMELVSELPLLSQLNLRGTGITGQQAARLRRFCKSECEILTGQALQTSLFNKSTRSNHK